MMHELEYSEGLPASLRNFRTSLSAHGSHANTPFGTSFVNFFNYDHGFLAPHRDRCLVTIVYSLAVGSTAICERAQHVHLKASQAEKIERAFSV